MVCAALVRANEKTLVVAVVLSHTSPEQMKPARFKSR